MIGRGTSGGGGRSDGGWRGGPRPPTPLARRRVRRRRRHLVPPQVPAPEPQPHRPVQSFLHDHLRSSQAARNGPPFDLIPSPSVPHRVIVGDGPHRLKAQDGRQRIPLRRAVGVDRGGRWHGETGVQHRLVLGLQIGVRGGDVRDATQPEFLDQAVLVSLEGPLDASLGLGGLRPGCSRCPVPAAPGRIESRPGVPGGPPRPRGAD